MPFQISALEKSSFADLFALSGEELARRDALRVTADKKPGYPCRVSLEDAEPGEELLLLNYEHLNVGTPYRSRYAIYVRAGVDSAKLQQNEVPNLFRSRILSLRGFSANGMLVATDLTEGPGLEMKIEAMLKNEEVSFIHLHYAKAGCYAARVDRVQ